VRLEVGGHRKYQRESRYHSSMEAPERPPSKSQRKRDMTALQDIGAELVALNDERLATLELPERLRDAISAAQAIRDFEGRRRQLQYIGKLMRDVDAAPIRVQLDQWRNASGVPAALHHLAEGWRERLITEDSALTLFATEYPSSDLQHLRSLIASVKRDRAANRPPKNYRELFRLIRTIVESE
jgi:ribosome-associated protein